MANRDLGPARRVGRGEAIEWGRRFRACSAIALVRVDEEIEEDAWSILEQHADTAWSHVDATSFALMTREDVNEVLSLDANVAQRGLRVLPEPPWLGPGIVHGGMVPAG